MRPQNAWTNNHNIETWFMKQQQQVKKQPKQEKPTKQKGKIRMKGLTEQEQNTSQTFRKIVFFFFSASPANFSNKTIFWYLKHQLRN